MKNFNSKKLFLAFSLLCSTYLVHAQSVTIEPSKTTNQSNTGGENINVVANSNSLGIYGRRFNGTFAAKTPVLNGNELFRVSSGGWWSASNESQNAAIKFIATENWNASGNGAKISFNTTPNTTYNQLERMVIDHNGNVGVGISTPASKFQVNENSTNPTSTFINIGTGNGVVSTTDAGKAGSFNSSSGFGIEAFSSTNMAISAGNGSATIPVAQFVNLSGGTALNLIATTAINITGAIKVSGGAAFRPAFTIVSTGANIFANQVIIPNTTLANSSNDILIITHACGSGAICNYNKAVGVYWDGGTSSWRIYAEDSTPMPVGVTFNILVIKQ